jgi:hypothetical protein
MLCSVKSFVLRRQAVQSAVLIYRHKLRSSMLAFLALLVFDAARSTRAHPWEGKASGAAPKKMPKRNTR